MIKGINLEGLRVVGDPNVFAKKYYNEGSDEILFVDSVASLYNRNNLTEIVKLACKDIFVPFTVGVESEILKMLKNYSFLEQTKLQ